MSEPPCLVSRAIGPSDSADSLARQRVMACLAAATGRRRGPGLPAQLSDAEWQALTSVAEVERVAPLVYLSLKGRSDVPVAVWEALRTSYRSTAARVALLRSTLETVLRELDTAGIRAVALKGAGLSHQVWTKLGLRPWSDIDLLVDRCQVKEAAEALNRLGFTPARPETTDGATLAHENELLLVGPNDTLVDLHWSLFDSPHYQALTGAPALWPHANRVDLLGAPAYVLRPEVQLLHLCGHLTLHHRGDELLWLNDIAELLARYRDELNWHVVCEQASALDLITALQRTLPGVVRTLAAPVSDQVLQSIAGLCPSARETAVVTRLTDRHRSMAARLLIDLRSMESWTERLAFLRTRMFPSVAYMKGRYNLSSPILVALSYPYRWLIGVRRASTD